MLIVTSDQASASAGTLGVERALLGALLQDPGRIHDVSYLTPAHFFDGQLGRIFGAIEKLTNQGDAVDPVTIAAHLGEARLRDDISALVLAAPGSEGLKTYGNAVLRHAVVRQIARTGELIKDIGLAADPRDNESVKGALAETEDLVSRLRTNEREGPARSDLLAADLAEGESHRPTGFHEIDEIIQGLRPKNLYVVAARPSVGKSTLATDIARAIAKTAPVLVFSIEMSRDEIYERILLAESHTPRSQMERRKLDDEGFLSLLKALDEVNRWPLFIDDSGTLTIQELMSRARRIARDTQLGVIVVDYIGKMTVAGKTENRTRELGIITGYLKALAKELNVPVVALSQLNRMSEMTKDNEPELFHLRESGEIEQDADVVIFLWRAEDDSYADVVMTNGKVAKSRNGRKGKFHLRLVGPQHRFQDR